MLSSKSKKSTSATDSPKAKAKKRSRTDASETVDHHHAPDQHGSANNQDGGPATETSSPARTKRSLTSLFSSKKKRKASLTSTPLTGATAADAEKATSGKGASESKSSDAADEDLVQLNIRTSCLDCGISSVCIEVTPATTCGDVLEDLVRQANLARKEREASGARGRKSSKSKAQPLDYADFCVCEVCLGHKTNGLRRFADSVPISRSSKPKDATRGGGLTRQTSSGDVSLRVCRRARHYGAYPIEAGDSSELRSADAISVCAAALDRNCPFVDVHLSAAPCPPTVKDVIQKIITETGRSRLSADECSLYLVPAGGRYDLQEWSSSGGLGRNLGGKRLSEIMDSSELPRLVEDGQHYFHLVYGTGTADDAGVHTQTTVPGIKVEQHRDAKLAQSQVTPDTCQPPAHDTEQKDGDLLSDEDEDEQVGMFSRNLGSRRSARLHAKMNQSLRGGIGGMMAMVADGKNSAHAPQQWTNLKTRSHTSTATHHQYQHYLAVSVIDEEVTTPEDEQESSKSVERLDGVMLQDGSGLEVNHMAQATSTSSDAAESHSPAPNDDQQGAVSQDDRSTFSLEHGLVDSEAEGVNSEIRGEQLAPAEHRAKDQADGQLQAEHEVEALKHKTDGQLPQDTTVDECDDDGDDEGSQEGPEAAVVATSGDRLDQDHDSDGGAVQVNSADPAIEDVGYAQDHGDGNRASAQDLEVGMASQTSQSASSTDAAEPNEAHYFADGPEESLPIAEGTAAAAAATAQSELSVSPGTEPESLAVSSVLGTETLKNGMNAADVDEPAVIESNSSASLGDATDEGVAAADEPDAHAACSATIATTASDDDVESSEANAVEDEQDSGDPALNTADSGAPEENALPDNHSTDGELSESGSLSTEEAEKELIADTSNQSETFSSSSPQPVSQDESPAEPSIHEETPDMVGDGMERAENASIEAIETVSSSQEGVQPVCVSVDSEEAEERTPSAVPPEAANPDQSEGEPVQVMDGRQSSSEEIVNRPDIVTEDGPSTPVESDIDIDAHVTAEASPEQASSIAVSESTEADCPGIGIAACVAIDSSEKPYSSSGAESSDFDRDSTPADAAVQAREETVADHVSNPASGTTVGCDSLQAQEHEVGGGYAEGAADADHVTTQLTEQERPDQHFQDDQGVSGKIGEVIPPGCETSTPQLGDCDEEATSMEENSMDRYGLPATSHVASSPAGAEPAVHRASGTLVGEDPEVAVDTPSATDKQGHRDNAEESNVSAEDEARQIVSNPEAARNEEQPVELDHGSVDQREPELSSNTDRLDEPCAGTMGTSEAIDTPADVERVDQNIPSNETKPASSIRDESEAGHAESAATVESSLSSATQASKTPEDGASLISSSAKLEEVHPEELPLIRRRHSLPSLGTATSKRLKKPIRHFAKLHQVVQEDAGLHTATSAGTSASSAGNTDGSTGNDGDDIDGEAVVADIGGRFKAAQALFGTSALTQAEPAKPDSTSSRPKPRPKPKLKPPAVGVKPSLHPSREVQKSADRERPATKPKPRPIAPKPTARGRSASAGCLPATPLVPLKPTESPPPPAGDDDSSQSSLKEHILEDGPAQSTTPAVSGDESSAHLTSHRAVEVEPDSGRIAAQTSCVPAVNTQSPTDVRLLVHSSSEESLGEIELPTSTSLDTDTDRLIGLLMAAAGNGDGDDGTSDADDNLFTDGAAEGSDGDDADPAKHTERLSRCKSLDSSFDASLSSSETFQRVRDLERELERMENRLQRLPDESVPRGTCNN